MSDCHECGEEFDSKSCCVNDFVFCEGKLPVPHAQVGTGWCHMCGKPFDHPIDAKWREDHPNV